MSTCGSCVGGVQPGDRFCATCGSPVNAEPVGVGGGHGLPPVTKSTPVHIDLGPEPVGPALQPSLRSPSTAVLLPPIDGLRGPASGEPFRALGGFAALATGLCLAVLLILPPIGSSGYDGQHLWTDSVTRDGWFLVRHDHESALWLHSFGPWLLVTLVVAAAVALIASLVALAGRSHRVGAWIIGAGAATAAAGLAIPHYDHDWELFTRWAIVAAGVVLVFAGLGVLNRRKPAGLPLQAVAMAGVIGLVIACGVGIPSTVRGSSSTSTYTPSSTSAPDATTPPATDPTDDTTPPAPAPSDGGSSDSLTNTYVVTETEAGEVAVTATLAFGAPEHISSDLSQGDLTFGDSCDVNTETDAVIPATITLANATPGSSVQAAAHLGSSNQVSGILAGFTNGPTCETSDFVVQSSNSQDSVTNMFIVLSDYYTSDNPSGDSSVLDDAYLAFTSATDSSTGETIMPTSIAGTGANSEDMYVPLSGSAQGSGDGE